MPKVPTAPVAGGRSTAPTVFQTSGSSAGATRQLATRVTPEAFGAAEGRALQRVGQALRVEVERHTKATDRIRRRQEAVDRVIILEATEEQLKAVVAEEQDTGLNFGTVDAVEAFHNTAAQIGLQAAEQHTGTEESHLILRGELTILLNRYGDAAVTAGAAEMRATQARQIIKFHGEVADEVRKGLSLADAEVKIRARAKQYEDSETPSETEDSIAAGMEQAVVASIEQSMILDVAEARKVFEANRRFLPPGPEQEMSNRITVMETTEAKKTAEFDARLDRYSTATGTPRDKIPKQVVLAAMGINLPREPRTLADKVLEIEQIRAAAGQPSMTPDQLDKAQGVFIKESGGDTLTPSAAQNFLTDLKLLQGYSENTLSAEDELLAQVVLSMALRPTIDSITGTSRPGLLPPAWINALAMRGQTPEQFTIFRSGQEALPTPQGALASTEGEQAVPQAGAALAEPSAAQIPAIPQAETTAQLEQPEATTALANLLSTVSAPEATVAAGALRKIIQEVAPFVFAGDKTLWDMGTNYTGLIPALRRVAGRTPGLGTVVGGGGVSSELEVFIPGFFRQIVELLRVNVRSQIEAEEIKDELNVESSAFDTAIDYQSRMIGVAKTLLIREKLAALALLGPLGPQEHRKLLFFHSLISQLRPLITPPLIAGGNQAETDKLGDKFLAENPPGTRFLWKDESDKWHIQVVPEAQKQEQQ